MGISAKLINELKRKERREAIDLEAKAYAYAKEHPELCWPIGKTIYYKNRYEVKVISKVDMALNGLPGTIDILAPMEEQPAHLRSPEFLAIHTKELKLGWVCWPDGQYVDYIKNLLKEQDSRKKNQGNHGN